MNATSWLRTKNTSAIGAAIALAACSGGGPSGTPGPQPIPAGPIAAPTPTSAPPPTLQIVSGTVVSIPQGTYGASAAPRTPRSGATVVIGNELIQGATTPPTLPGNDVVARTDAAGHFSAKISPPAAPPTSTSLYTFVAPYKNVFGVTFPSQGYFVMVFPSGADGVSADKQLPVHSFVAIGAGGSLGTFRSTIASVDEAGWLQQANLDRGAKGALPNIFDETAEEAARQHAAEMLGEFSLCDYNLADQGPQTRYDLLGGIGQQSANIGIYGGQIGSTTTTTFWRGIEAAFVAEANIPPPNDYHYTALVYPGQIWMGLGVATGPWTPPGGSLEQFFTADMELVNVIDSIATVAADVSGCPAGIVANES